MSTITRSNNMMSGVILVKSTIWDTKGGESKLTKGVKVEKGERGLPSATIAASQVT